MPDAHPAHLEPAHDLDNTLPSVERQQNVSTPRHTLPLAALSHNRPQIATIARTQMILRWFAPFHSPCSFLCELASADELSASIHIKI
jgi:hypothetical protein